LLTKVLIAGRMIFRYINELMIVGSSTEPGKENYLLLRRQ